jgi:hypothetical protein
MKRYLFVVALACLTAAAQDRFRRPQFPPDMIAQDSPIRDIAKLDTVHVKVETESSRLRLLRIRLPAGEALQTHDEREGVLVCVTACSLNFINPAGYLREVKLEAGQTVPMAAARNRVTNIGAAVEFLFFEVKKLQ